MGDRWTASPLTVDPPTFPLGVADHADIEVTYDGADPVTGATAKVYWPDREEVLSPDPLTTPSGQAAIVAINAPTLGLRRGRTYKLEVTYTLQSGRVDTRNVYLLVDR